MTDTLHELVTALQQPALFPHPVTDFSVIETHISIILLTGTFAYKFKKPVDFGFLDFSSLEKRRHYCEEELRLNRRLAPELYLEVVPVCAGPKLGAGGEVIEYAVRMREFEQASQFDRLLDAGRLSVSHINALALRIAEFHTGVAVAGPESRHGRPDAVQAPVEENFSQVLACMQDPRERERLVPLQDWTRQANRDLQTVLQARKDGGYIRECHGDLHLGNIALIDGEPVHVRRHRVQRLPALDRHHQRGGLPDDGPDPSGRTDLSHWFLNVWLEHQRRFHAACHCCASTRCTAPWCGPRSIACARTRRTSTPVSGRPSCRTTMPTSSWESAIQPPDHPCCC